LKIAIFDYSVTSRNAIGKCHLSILAALCHEHDFTVFSVEFENPCPERIHWVRIPAIQRPLALLFLTFHFLAPLRYLWYRTRHRRRFDLIQIVESNSPFGDVAYSHFCHRAFLKYHWRATGARGMRGFLRWLDHRLHSAVEPWTYRRAHQIIVPSRGLARELISAYPFTSSKIRILPNPVDISRMRRPEAFDVTLFRKGLGLDAGDVVVVFVALGQYERKGLPTLLEAVKVCDEDCRVKLIVVGGTRDLIAAYRQRVLRLGIPERVIFTGTQADVRPYLWSSDAFALPSHYEVFPLVALEAAAAGLPLVVTALNGVEEFFRDGESGFLVRQDTRSLAEALRRLVRLTSTDRAALGKFAQGSVSQYDASFFTSAWAALYQGR
jgi:glycosyltransferase involved in cell wall biosynthesis